MIAILLLVSPVCRQQYPEPTRSRTRRRVAGMMLLRPQRTSPYQVVWSRSLDPLGRTETQHYTKEGRERKHVKNTVLCLINNRGGHMPKCRASTAFLSRPPGPSHAARSCHPVGAGSGTRAHRGDLNEIWILVDWPRMRCRFPWSGTESKFLYPQGRA